MKTLNALRRYISRPEREEIERLNDRLASVYVELDWWKKESYKWEDAYINVCSEMRRNDKKNYSKPKQKKKKESNPKLTLIKN